MSDRFILLANPPMPGSPMADILERSVLVKNIGEPVHVMDLKKANPTEDEDGVLTRFGMEVAHRYAKARISGKRDTKLEREHPELVGLFFDIRYDRGLANEYAIPFED